MKKQKMIGIKCKDCKKTRLVTAHSISSKAKYGNLPERCQKCNIKMLKRYPFGRL